ncbi:DEAD/DEAH box helicase (plasmid) [Candidatus Trichorickettsia mobilis]|uniref:DEAD/DEAH box helicase n=1 Tax=Candidatus Trichorickettsia mobilis TaxID=1346319 RepID=UPI002B263271|nr:DEAD/DEAH box helicase [Candidatus Trichorickettsia mobilis]WPY01761.1 DEAD/DEAH box helicase [Candidatus Trichorickettsia mobilis]
MLLRERQREFVERNIAALIDSGSTLGVAPTGAGKTICLSAVVGELSKSTASFKTCVLAHRDELTYQNLAKFSLINPHVSTSLYNAEVKSWEGQVTFAMVQTLAKENNLKTMPQLDLIVIDEAHHATAKTYQAILDHAKKLNPLVKIFGVTATPNRGDKSGLGRIFDNCGDQIKIWELIASGHLVRPKTFIIDLGNTQEKLQALRVRASSGDYSEQEVAGILDTIPLNSEVVKHWQEKASNRKTVVFCSSIEHAKNITNAFNEAGIKAVLVTGECSLLQRKLTLEAVTSGKAQVIVNVAILTEGWDFPPISCVVLLRQSSYKSTMIQMVGRGLRTIDHAIYPNIEKNDCVVLDFGISSIIHGNLEQSVDLTLKAEGYKLCTSCKKKIPKSSVECPLCGCDLLKQESEASEKESESLQVIANFKMREIDLLKRSGFSWTVLELEQEAMIASGFNSWCCILKQNDNSWSTIGGSTKRGEESNRQVPSKVVYSCNKAEAIEVGNDFLYRFEDEEAARKTASWRGMSPSESQLKWLPEKYKASDQLTKGDASNYLTFIFNAQPKLRELGFVL